MAWARLFKKVVPIALAGAAALLVAIPMSESASDWNHRGQMARQAWLARHQNWFGGWHHSHATAPANVYGYTPRTYGNAPLAYGYAPRAAIPSCPP